jgi:hypothetical protein
MEIKCIAYVLMLSTSLLYAQPKNTSEFSKNNLPCIAEICVGDGLTELEKIKWEKVTAQSPFSRKKYLIEEKVSPDEIKKLQKNWKEINPQNAQYLPNPFLGHFDNDNIKDLSKLTATCSSSSLTGHFVSASGNPTFIKIRLKSWDKDFTKQQWSVISILRTYPKAKSDKQKDEIEKELNERYKVTSTIYAKAFDSSKSFNVNETTAGVGFYEFGTYGDLHNGFSVGITLSRIVESNDAERLKMHPFCGGNEKISIN